MITVGTLCDFLGAFAPLSLAAEWDNVGLLLGDTEAPVFKVMTCLTITPPVVEEAIAEGVNLIVTHHPILFRGAKKLTTQSGDGQLVWPLARAGIAVYSPHTAFDNCKGGINDSIAEGLGLSNIRPLRPVVERRFKIVVFVPENDLGNVSDAMFAAGAGIIGEYSQCSYLLSGTGTFFGSEHANPTIGQKGQRETVAERRLEVVCPTAIVDRVVAAMRRAHSYEEPAFDVYPLHDQPGAMGAGRIGEYPEPVILDEVICRVKASLRAPLTQVVGEIADPIFRVAIACGAAGEFLPDAVRAGADLFLTGEMRFHDYLTAQRDGIALVLPGHYASERPAVEALARRLGREFPAVVCWCSKRERDPVAGMAGVG